MSIDRRRSARQVIHRPCKVLHRPSHLYARAETQDISDHGVLLKVFAGRPFTEGEEIDLAIAWTNEPVLMEASMARGTVARSVMEPDHSQWVGVEFARAEAALAAA